MLGIQVVENNRALGSKVLEILGSVFNIEARAYERYQIVDVCP